MKTLKSRKTYFSDYKDGQECDKFLGIVEEFDQFENLIEKHTYDSDGSTTLSEYFQFIEHKLIRKEVYDPETERRSITTYQYQGDLLIEEMAIYENNTFVKKLLSYDSNNNLIQTIEIDESKTVLSKAIATYTRDKIEIKRYDENATLYETESIDVDESGNEVGAIITTFSVGKYNEEEQLIINRVFENNKLVKEEVERDDVIIQSSLAAYDDEGKLLISEAYDFNDEETHILNYSYNERNLESSNMKFVDEKHIKTTYIKYDSNDKPIEVIEEIISLDDVIVIDREEFVNTYY